MTEVVTETRADSESLPLENVRVRGVTRLITPTQIKEQLPASRLHRNRPAYDTSR